MNLARFSFDGGEAVIGWADGTTWNGWSCPLFDEAQLPAAMKVITYGTVSRDGDTVLVVDDEDSTHVDRYEPVIIGGKRYWRFDGLTWNQDDESSETE